MATTAIERRIGLQPGVRHTLDRLRTAIRWYVAVEGVGLALAWLGAAFWLSLATDWLFEPPKAVRAFVVSAAGLVFGWVMIRQILLRAARPLSDASMAVLLERRFRQLDDTLLTAVILGSRSPEPEKCDPRMLARTCGQAAQRIQGVRLGEVFDFAPLRRSLLAGFLLAVSVVLMGAAFPELLGVWARRNLLLADQLYPRRTYLEVLGFDPPERTRKVARGADLDVVVRAYARHPLTDKPLVIPDRVEVRYRTEGGLRGRKPMSREGRIDPAGDPWQEYSLKFESILSSLSFDVVGGDDRLRDLRIQVVDSPAVTQMVLNCRYPDYMGRAPRRLPVTGAMQVPLGTDVTVHARTSKELTGVQVDSRGGDLSEPVMLGTERLAADRRGFSYRLGLLQGDCTLLFTLSDTDGITLREPVPLGLVAVPDEPPQMGVRLDGIGTAITPEARLPFAGRISDDYGLARVWAETVVDEQPAAEVPLAEPADRPVELSLDAAALEVRQQALAPGQKLLVCVKAADLCDLAEGPNVGTSERWLLDVVTADQLRAMLESRELVLRQRFEVIIAEMTETRDVLAGLEFAPPAAPPEDHGPSATDPAAPPEDEPPSASDPPEPSGTATSTPTAAEAPAPGEGAAAGAEGSETGEPAEGAPPPEPGSGDEPAAGSGESPTADEGGGQATDPPEHRLALRILQIERVLQNSRKNAYETEGVAESFDDIYKQLVNNRIDTEELKRRIGEGIAGPLYRVADEMFPELERRLEALRESAGDPARGPLARQRAVEQADRILVAMREILDRMIELEDFNQAVELLRTIIKLQDELDEETKERLRQKLRELLED